MAPKKDFSKLKSSRLVSGTMLVAKDSLTAYESHFKARYATSDVVRWEKALNNRGVYYVAHLSCGHKAKWYGKVPPESVRHKHPCKECPVK